MKRRLRPTFLTLDEVLALHADQIARYGGEPGLRHLGLLESALATPRATYGRGFLHGSLPETAAAYLFHLAGNRAVGARLVGERGAPGALEGRPGPRRS